MKIFIKYNPDGNILSVSRLEVMPAELEQPFGALKEGEQCLEVSSTGEFSQMGAMQIHENYRVDVERKELVKKS